ncbi:MAG: M13 family metallopeptidase [Rubricoccaceae bacterium]|nr:M13 family metallopeptidase [Rubricoccaceae bacterium]
MRLLTAALALAFAVAPAASAQQAADGPARSAGSAGTLGLGIDPDAMDRSARPQDDLFRFVNGRWLDETEIPADRSRYGSFDILREKAERDVRAIIEDAAAGRVSDPDAAKIGAVYTAYMDSARVEALGLTPLRPDLDRIAAVETADGLARYFAGNAQSFGPLPFRWYVDVDDKNVEQHVLHVSQSGLGLPDKSYYEEDEFAEQRAAYLAYLEALYGLAGFEGGAEAAQTVLDLETALAAVQWTRVENRDSEATYNKVALDDFAAAHPNLRLDVLLPAAGVPMRRVDSLVVRQPSYFEALDGLMAEIPLADWKEWAQARTLDEAAPYLPQAFEAARFAFRGQTLSGQEADRVRWKKAVRAVNGALGEAVGRIYVARHYPPEAEARMDRMILNLQEAMRQSIRELDWMGDATKAEALRKLDSYTFKVGYPDAWEDYGTLEVRPDDLVGNLRRTAAWRYADMLADLGQPVDRSEWFMTPQTVNAYYNPVFNEIVFPAAILQPPFFNVEADDAVNYGAIGAVIGHEFSHGFDDQGSQYDADGTLKNWWTDADREEFERRADLLVAQYSAYRPFEDAAIDGELTLGENIGDLSGLTMAHRAYRLSLDGEEPPVIEGFTGDQRFFMGWVQVWRIKHRDAYLRQLLRTDTHSPGQYRAVGPLAHIPAFYTAFDVRQGDALYLPPEERIKLW